MHLGPGPDVGNLGAAADPIRERWTPVASPAVGAVGQRAILLADGSVLVMCGLAESGDITSAEVFTPAKAAG